MIASLTGTLQSYEANLVTFDVKGVGYEVACTQSCLAQLLSAGDKDQAIQTLLVYTDIKEDSIKLYGFVDRLEKHVFLLLLRVKGLGARTACDLVSRVDKRDLLRFVSQGDITQLQKIKGVGKKTAERIIVELRDIMLEYSKELSIGASTLPTQSHTINAATMNFDEAYQALIALGLQQRDAQGMLDLALSAEPELKKADSSALIKAALQYI